MKYQNLWEAAKSLLRETFIALNIYTRNEKSQINELFFHLKKQRKGSWEDGEDEGRGVEEHMKSKVSRKTEIIKNKNENQPGLRYLTKSARRQ